MSAQELFVDPIANVLRRWWLQHQIKTHEKTIDAIGNNLAAAQRHRTELRQELRAMKADLAAL